MNISTRTSTTAAHNNCQNTQIVNNSKLNLLVRPAQTMHWFFVFMMLATGTFVNNAFAQTNGIYESYAILSINGGANAYYDMNATTGNPDFQGAALGNFAFAQSLVVKGGQNKTFKCSGGDITNGRLKWRVWKTSAGASGSFTTETMGFVSNDAGGCGGNQTWEGTGGATNVITGLLPGNYTLEVFSDADGVPGTTSSNNGGANYKGTFNVTAPNPVFLYQGVNTGGGTYYATVKDAFDAINLGTYTGALNIRLYGNTTEAATAVLNASGGTSSYSSLLINPDAGTAITVTGAITGRLIDLNGADNVTIDGLNTGGNSLTISNTATGASAAIRFIADATANTIQKCTILGSASTLANGVIMFGLGNVTGNDGNNINNCNISAAGVNLPINCIYSLGSSAAIDNSGNTINANNISNFFSAGSASRGLFLDATGNSTWTITNNRVFQSATRVYTTANTHVCIQALTGEGYTITGNIMGFANSAGTGTYNMVGATSGTLTGTFPTSYTPGSVVANATQFRGLSLTFNAVTSAVASSIQNNTVAGVAVYSSGTAVQAINVFAGNANIGTVTGNTIGSTTGTGSIYTAVTVTASNTIGILAQTANTITIRNNTIGAIDAMGASAASAGSIVGIQLQGTGLITVTGNTVGNSTNPNLRTGTLTDAGGNNSNSGVNFGISTGASNFFGIFSANTGTNLLANVIIGTVALPNTIRNASQNSSGATATFRGILAQSGTINITGNIITNITSASTNPANSKGGIGTNQNRDPIIIRQNTISNLSCTNASSAGTYLTGIYVLNGAVVATYDISRNRISNLTNASTSVSATVPGIVAGITFGNPISTTSTVTNNMISLGNGQATNTSFIGIHVQSTAAVYAVNAYYNTINIEGNATSGAQPSFGFLRGDFSATAVQTTVDVRNNIFNNTRTSSGAGTGKHYAIGNHFGAVASNIGWPALASNYNVLNANAATVGYWNADQTYAGWQTASASDANGASQTAVPVTFVNTATADLHLNMGLALTLLESGGTPIAGVTIDYDNQTRPGPAGSVNGGASNPDYGADEFDGVSAFPTVTGISVAPGGNQCVAVPHTVTVTANPTTGTLGSVTINYSLNGVAQIGIPMTGPAGGGVWTGAIPAAVPANAIVVWSVTATNTLFVSTTSATQFYADEPLLGATAAASANPGTVCSGSPSVLTALITASNFALPTSFYCASSFSNSDEDDIGQVTFAGINNPAVRPTPQSANAAANAVYTDHTGTPAGSVNAGTTYPMTVYHFHSTTDQSGNACNVYIDFNQNGSFSDPGETFSIPKSAGGFYSDFVGNITIPASALAGNTRMRVIVSEGTVPSPCGTINSWGETEDYILNIKGYGNTTILWSNAATTNPTTVNPTSNTSYSAALTYLGCVINTTTSATVNTTALPASPSGSNSSRCGTGVPTVAVGTGGQNGVFRWYSAATGGTLLQTGGATYLASINSTTTFYVSEDDGLAGCESLRTPVIATVTSPDIVVATSNGPVCTNSSLTLTANVTVQNNTPASNYTYTWSAAAGSGITGTTPGGSGTFGGGATNTNVTPTVGNTYTYTVNAVDPAPGGCATFATVSVLVKPQPVIDSVRATPATVCAGGSSNLNVYTNFTTSGPQGLPGVYCPALHSAGPQSEIISVAFNTLSNAPGTQVAPFYNIYPASGSTTTTVARGNTYPLTLVTNGSIFQSIIAVWFDWNRDGVFDANTTEFVTPQPWLSGTSGTVNITVPVTATLGQIGMRVRTRTTTNALGIGDACLTIGSGSTHDYTINVVNVVTQDPALTYAWNNGGGSGSSVNVTLPTPPSQSYTATVSDPVTGCSSTGNVTVTVNAVPTAPTATPSSQCGSGIPIASVTSTSGAPTPIFKWYDAPTAGNLLQTGTSVTYTTSISTTTTFHVSEISAAGCEGPRVAVVVTVTDPDPLTVTSSTGPDACAGEAFNITSTYTADFNDFATFTLTASPQTGSGITNPVVLTPAGAAPTTGSAPYSVTPTIPGTYVYTISAYDPDKDCASVNSVTVTMHAYPVVDSLTTNPSPAVVCAGTPVTLNVYSALTTTGPQTAPAGYATSAATDAGDEEIFNVSFGTLSQSSTCATTGGPAANGLPASILRRYSNYTGSVSAPTLHKGDVYNLAVTTSPSCGADFGMRLGIYADWNRDGDFNDASEIIFEDAAIVSALRTLAGTVTIPSFASLGKTLFRVVCKEQDVPSATGTYFRGETEDYLINIDNVQLPNPNLTFSWNNGGGAGNTVVVTPLTTTTYTASLNASGCITTATPVTVTVNPVPTVPTATNATQCGPGIPGVSVTSTSGLPTPIYKWYNAPTGGTLLQSSTSNTYTSVISVTTTFYVSEATAAGCESASRVAVTETITAAPALSITPGSTTSFCIGGSVSLAASGAGYVNFAWTAVPSVGSGIASPSSATTVVTPTISGAIVYTVTANDGVPVTGCQNITTITVNSNPYPVIDSVVANPSTICVGGTSTLGVYSNVTLTGPSGLPAVYCVPTYTNIQGTARITDVSFNTLSNTNIATTIPYYDIYPAFGSTTTTVIRGNTYPINLTTSTPSIISVWIDWNRDGIFSNTEWYQPWINASTGTLNITIPVGATLGQTGMRIRTRTNGNANGDFDACTAFGASGSAQDYTINIINQVLQNPAFTYTWATASAGANPVVSPVVTTSYTPTVTSAAGCATVGSPVTVTVTTVGSAASATPNPTCVGTAVTVSANATGGGPFTYLWSTGATTPTITVSPAVTTTYSVVVKDVCLNSAPSSSVTVTVNPLPTASIQQGPGPLSVCTPGTQLLTAVTNAGSATYQWTLNGANIPGATSPTYTVSAVSTGTYRVIVTNTVTGCASAPSTGVVVTINPIPGVVTITPPAPTICTGASQSLTASALLVAGDATGSAGPINLAIPDLSTVGVTSSLNLAGVPAGAIIDSVVAIFSITHSFEQEIIVNLEGPNGQIINLVSGVGILGGNDFVNTRISSDNTRPAIPFSGGSPFTATYRADAALTGFEIAAVPAPTTNAYSNLFGAGNGTWKLRVYDDRAASLGTLTQFDLKISYHASPVTYAWTPLTALTPANGLGATVTAGPVNANTTYTATATNGFGCTNSGNVTVTVADCPVTVNLKLFLQGYYTGGSTMQPVLNNQGVAALATETDTVLVELHDPTTFALVDAAQGVLSTTGMVSATFAPHPFAPYVIAVKHRSTVQTWTKNPIPVNGASPLYNFSTAANKAAGDNQVNLGSGVFGFYTGDLNQDDFIDGNDFPQYSFESESGGLYDGTYTATDMNGDGFVDSNDFPVFDTNIFNGVSAIYP